MIASLCVFYDWRHHGDCRRLWRIWIFVTRSLLWAINQGLVGIFENFKWNIFLLIYCLHKNINNQKCYTSHKVFLIVLVTPTLYAMYTIIKVSEIFADKIWLLFNSLKSKLLCYNVDNPDTVDIRKYYG